ncbi:hypothetical protein, partial [Pseudomonas fluorescens]|uniref:hypothetical protein n=1 Tax=Pseudomonas fluorescens TaxID=294 RepID=UPI002B1D11AD
REGGGSYKTDFSDIEGGKRFVIECKKMGQNLLTVSNSDKSFTSSIDQAIKYLDHYKSNFSVVTNGFQWTCFKKFFHDFQDGYG